MKTNSVLHLLPGRVRLRVPGLKRNLKMTHALGQTLAGLPGILGHQINISTGSVLIYFDPAQIDHHAIILALDVKRREHTNPINLVPLPPHFAVEWPTIHVMLIGSAILGLLFKNKVLGRSSTASSLGIDLAVFVSILSGYPVFAKRMDQLPRLLNFNISTVLEALSLSFLFMKDSMQGLLVSLLFSFARLAGEINITKSQQVVGKLDLWPLQARVWQDGQVVSLPSQQVLPQQLLIINAGETIPADGVVLVGTAEIDESRLTGFPEFIQKKPGEYVLAGSAVISGALQVKAEKVGSDTYIRELMLQSLESNSPERNPYALRAQSRINRLASLAILLAGVNYVLTRNSSRSLTMLLAALPSAAGLALPTTYGFTTGKAARKKIYLKNPDLFETAAHIDAVAFDKTGTLSSDQLTIEDVVVLDRHYNKADLIRLASSVEGSIRLPLAQAIRDLALAMNIRPLSAAQAIEVTGDIGIHTHLKEKHIHIGTKSFMSELQIPLDKALTKLVRFHHLGCSPVFIAVDHQLVGLFGVRESLKPQSRMCIESLRALGIQKFLLLTGDSEEAAQMAGEELGISECHGELDPYQKAEYVRILSEQGLRVAVVGDGVDDGIAMKEGALGICLGSKGLDSSARVADVVIASRNPHDLVEFFRLSQEAWEVSEQNLNLAIGLNVIGLGMGAGGFISPVGAGLLDNAGIFAVLLNSMATS